MAMVATHIIKRTGHSEPYIEGKLHTSISQACLAARVLEGEAALIADRIAEAVTGWVHDKLEITSRDIRSLAHERLQELHADAAYAYAVHDSVL